MPCFVLLFSTNFFCLVTEISLHLKKVSGTLTIGVPFNCLNYRGKTKAWKRTKRFLEEKNFVGCEWGVLYCMMKILSNGKFIRQSYLRPRIVVSNWLKYKRFGRKYLPMSSRFSSIKNYSFLKDGRSLNKRSCDRVTCAKQRKGLLLD